jgi:hypothetical protein
VVSGPRRISQVDARALRLTTSFNSTRPGNLIVICGIMTAHHRAVAAEGLRT